MESKDIAELLGKPIIARLKDLGSGLKVGKVLGRRVLVKTVIPFTQMDQVEREGLLTVPKWVKRDNTPMPSTGVVVQLGNELIDQYMMRAAVDHAKSPDCWPIQEGSLIMFSKFAGTDFMIEEEGFRILDEREVLCTLEMVKPDAITPVKEDPMREDGL